MCARAIGDFFQSKTKRCIKESYLSWSESKMEKKSPKYEKKTIVSYLKLGRKMHDILVSKSVCWRQRCFLSGYRQKVR